MARSRTDSLIYATILLAPLVTAIVYVATRPGPRTIVVTVPAASGPTTEAVELVADAPAPTMPVSPAPPIPEAVAPAPTMPVPPAPPIPEAVAPAPTEPGPTTPPTADPTAGASMLVYDRKLVLSTAADRSWARGRLQFDASVEPYEVIAWKSVAPSRLPAPLRSLIDATVTVYAADGTQCAAQVGALSIHGLESGDLFVSDEDRSEPTRAQLREVRQQVFDSASLLLGEITGTCDGVWARRADLPAPAVFAAQPLDAALETTLREQVSAALANHPDVLAMRAEYDAFAARRDPADETPPWPAYFARTLGMLRFDEIGGARSLLNVELGDGGEACGDYFTTRVAVLFTLTADQADLHGDGFLDPLTIVDLERDGDFEAVTEEGRALAGDSFSFPIHGCPC